jgi:hypothetical protein
VKQTRRHPTPSCIRQLNDGTIIIALSARAAYL